MPQPRAFAEHPASLEAAALLDACIETRTRRSGPGGQHRNKTETAVILVHRPTGISAEASERRSQAENRTMALMRLRLALAIEHRTAAADGPSARWRLRVRDRRIAVAVGHDDFPALIAEAFDQVHHHRFDMPRAAAVLGVTPTQLLKLFKRCPAAWTSLNRLRADAGLSPLR